MANTRTNAPCALEGLALQARMFVQSAAMNLLQLGRVLTEAKPLVGHGGWAQWVRENAKMSVRTAEQYMQAYAEFGLDARIAELGTSKVIKLLPMSEEERARLLEEHDVPSMSAREMDDAIRRLRDEARQAAADELARERESRIAAERRAEELANRAPEIPEELVDELRRDRAEIERLAGMNRDSIEAMRRMNEERAKLERDLKEQDALLTEQQEAYNRAQEELLNLQSAKARDDTERTAADALTPEVFSMAASAFIGACCRMPQMSKAFMVMDNGDRQRYDEVLKAVEAWAAGARRALDSYSPEGVYVLE